MNRETSNKGVLTAIESSPLYPDWMNFFEDCRRLASLARQRRLERQASSASWDEPATGQQTPTLEIIV